MIESGANQGLADRLFLVKYEIDEENCHLVITDPEDCKRCEDKPCICRCPAEVYRWEEEEETPYFAKVKDWNRLRKPGGKKSFLKHLGLKS